MKKMNTPNMLTMLRIAITPVFLLFLLEPNFLDYAYFYALGLFIFASITDIVDGHIARSQGIITDFGKFWDPIADKILVTSAFVGLLSLGAISPWVVVMIIFREFIVTSIRMMASGEKVIAANWWGKVKTILQMSVIIATIAVLAFGKYTRVLAGGNLYSNILNYVTWAQWICAVFTLLSGLVYLYQNRHLLNTNR